MFTRRSSKRKEAVPKPDKGAVVFPMNSGTRGLEFLVELVKKIRPDKPGDFQKAELQFRSVLYSLQQDRSMLFALRRSMLSLFINADIVNALTESGMTSSMGFIQELTSKLKHKLLPSLQKKNDFLYVLNRVFFRKTDHKWVEGIDPELWVRFFELMGIRVDLSGTELNRQLQRSLQILSYRLATSGLEKEITRQYINEDTSAYPFVEQNRLVNLYFERFRLGGFSYEQKLLINNISEALHNCRQELIGMREQRVQFGTSLAQTYLMMRSEQLIERMLIILDALDNDQQFNTERFIGYFCRVIRFENTKNSVGEFLSANLGMLAYQIAEHKGRKGESYISSTPREIMALFRGAMLGGFIVSFIAIFKNLLGKLPLAPFWQGFLYGTNYAFGFVLMDQTGGTLATKQPAYTASAVAGSLDARKAAGRPDLRNLAITVGKVVRSQSASFAGNLIMVFPGTWALAWLWDIVTGTRIAEGAAALRLMEDQHPWHSLALLYACFTGFFLFLSGIIAGYVENHIVYGSVPERLATHPILSFTMSRKRLDRLANFVRRRAGALAGSISLGFFLGIAGPLGKVMGLPFDIRHITISAGNAAIGFYGLDHDLPLSYVLIIVGGVLLIGFLNFMVSFSLAFYVAVRSRGIQLKDYPELIGLIWRYFRRHPMDFVLPPINPRTPEQLS